MKRHLLALAGLAAFMGANQPTATTAPATARSSNEVAVKRSHNSQRSPQTDSTQAPTQVRRVAAQPVLPFSADLARYFQKQGPRRVKYGKSRWVVLS